MAYVDTSQPYIAMCPLTIPDKNPLDKSPPDISPHVKSTLAVNVTYGICQHIATLYRDVPTYNPGQTPLDKSPPDISPLGKSPLAVNVGNICTHML